MDDGSGGVSENVDDGNGGHDNNDNNMTMTAVVAVNDGERRWPQITINHCDVNGRRQDVGAATGATG